MGETQYPFFLMSHCCCVLIPQLVVLKIDNKKFMKRQWHGDDSYLVKNSVFHDLLIYYNVSINN